MAEPLSPRPVSRYRSQRKPQQLSGDYANLPPPAPHEPPQASSPGLDGVARSKSRYRRPGTASGGAQPWTPRDPEQLDVSLRPATSKHDERGVWLPNRADPATSGSVRRSPSKRYHGRRESPPVQAGAQDARRVRSNELDEEVEQQRRQRLQARYGEQAKHEAEEHHTPKQPNESQLFPPLKPEPVQPATKTVQFDGPPTSQGIRATKSLSSLQEQEDNEKGGCFGLFKRKRGEATPGSEKEPIARRVESPVAIKAGGGGSVPGTDAPVSAVNAGDRTVLVECGKSKSIFPVTPTTTPVDIIKQAATCMDESISLKSAVLLEHFGTVGVQRPLRRYEHIRDVMNSWDTDRQNSLLLVDPGIGTSEADLSVAGVPSQRPGEQSWLLHISQKPGKWDKRLITLKSDGQVTLQKDPRKPKDQVNVCHLSDFDIYRPTEEKTRKKIKPPKKICYAVKSQQKTSMFQSMEDFVHFFSTGDRRTADEFYAGVQGWRSWYLVHVMGEGTKAKETVSSAAEKERAGGTREKEHKAGNSYDSHYQLGSFKSLMDVDAVGRRPMSSDGPGQQAGFTKSSSQFDTTISPERRTSTAKRRQQPLRKTSDRGQLAEDEPLANLGRQTSVTKGRRSLDQNPTKTSPEEFVGSGLLGRNYSQRRRETDDRERKGSAPSPFTAGNNLLKASGNDDQSPHRAGGLNRHSSTGRGPENTAEGGVQRHSSTRRRSPPDVANKNKPLVDLTPAYREAPQHKKSGKGFYPEHGAAAGPLIGNATSPEDPIGAPPSTEWQRSAADWQRSSARNSPASHSPAGIERTTSLSRNAGNHRTLHRPNTGTVRTKSNENRPTGSVPRQDHHTLQEEQNAAFTEGGLLASRGGEGWGGGDQGRGVLDGSRAKGPMVDLREESTFVHGSLLQKKESGAVEKGPIDRNWDRGV